MALSIWAAGSANWPEYGRITPILTVGCASTGGEGISMTIRLTSPSSGVRMELPPWRIRRLVILPRPLALAVLTYAAGKRALSTGTQDRGSPPGRAGRADRAASRPCRTGARRPAPPAGARSGASGAAVG